MTDTVNKLPVIETIKLAWSKVRGAKTTFFALFIVFFVLQVLTGYFYQRMKAGDAGIFIDILYFVCLILLCFISWGMIYLGIQRAQDSPIHTSMVRYVFDVMLFIRMLGYYLLILLIISLPAAIMWGFIPLFLHSFDSDIAKLLLALVYIFDIVFSVYLFMLAVKLSYAKLIIIAQKIGPWTAMKMAYNATRGNGWRLCGLFIINILIVMLGLITLIGSIWAMPYVMINYGVVYRKLIVGEK